MALANAQPHESRLYYEFSHLYDLLFRRVFYPRIARVIRSLAIEPGARVLELGVGTGLSLDAYPSHCQVTGIDLAPDMLERAQDKVNGNAWRHITLEQGDALNLKFPDDSFDYVMAFHVVSVVPDPDRMMSEARDRPPAAHDRPGHALARLDHAPARGRARSLHAARRPTVEDVAALALHHRGGAQRQGRARGALGAAPARPPLGGRARVGA